MNALTEVAVLGLFVVAHAAGREALPRPVPLANVALDIAGALGPITPLAPLVLFSSKRIMYGQ